MCGCTALYNRVPGKQKVHTAAAELMSMDVPVMLFNQFPLVISTCMSIISAFPPLILNQLVDYFPHSK